MAEDREFREIFVKLATIEALMVSQAANITNLKKDLADMYKKINWANAKINWFLGGIVALGFGAGFIFKVMDYTK